MEPSLGCVLRAGPSGLLVVVEMEEEDVRACCQLQAMIVDIRGGCEDVWQGNEKAASTRKTTLGMASRHEVVNYLRRHERHVFSRQASLFPQTLNRRIGCSATRLWSVEC